MMENEILNKYRNVIFLDIDGVLNSQLFYAKNYALLTKHDGIPFYKTVKKYLRKIVKKKEISELDYHKSQIDGERIIWLNELCEETNSAIVLSSTWRSGKTIEQLQKTFDYCGATFTIIDKTGHCEDRIRGVEIYNWIKGNSMKWFGVNYYDFYRYAIIDDDSDMLLRQQNHFFHVDGYAGLTPNTCYKIRRFFNHETF